LNQTKKFEKIFTLRYEVEMGNIRKISKTRLISSDSSLRLIKQKIVFEKMFGMF